MAEKIIMPQGGQDIMEGRVLRWHKAEGDPVQKDEVLCDVETEKAVFEVKSPTDGVLLKIVVSEGKVAQVFSTIGFVGAAGESVEVEADEDEAPEKRREAKPEKKESGIDVPALEKRGRPLVRPVHVGSARQSGPDGIQKRLADFPGLRCIHSLGPDRAERRIIHGKCLGEDRVRRWYDEPEQQNGGETTDTGRDHCRILAAHKVI